MALEAHELEQIGDYVKNHLNLWLAEIYPVHGTAPHVFELNERMIRVEEELKNQRELMKRGFDQVDRRFEQVDKRFEQVDKRFEQVNKRFEQVDKHFEQVDARFGLVYDGLEGLTKRVENLSTRMFQFMLWSFGFTATAAGVVISVIKFL